MTWWWLGWALGLAAVLAGGEDEDAVFPHRAFQLMMFGILVFVRLALKGG